MLVNRPIPVVPRNCTEKWRLICCVCGVPRHKLFYFNRTRVDCWIKAVGAENIDQKFILNNFRLCSIHFEDRYFCNALKDRLVRHAIPTLFLSKIQYFEEPHLRGVRQRIEKVLIKQKSDDEVKYISDESDHEIQTSGEEFENGISQTVDESEIKKSLTKESDHGIQISEKEFKSSISQTIDEAKVEQSLTKKSDHEIRISEKCKNSASQTIDKSKVEGSTQTHVNKIPQNFSTPLVKHPIPIVPRNSTKKWRLICCVCAISRDKLFSFNRTRLECWIKAVGAENIDRKFISYNFRLCSIHFEDRYFCNALKDRLVRHAIPTLFLSKVQYFEQPKLEDFRQKKTKVYIVQVSNDKVKDTVKESNHEIHTSKEFENNISQTRDELEVETLEKIETIQNRFRSQIQCTQCPKTFNSLYAYKHHRRTKHSNQFMDQIIQVLAQKQTKLSGKFLVVLKMKQTKQPVTKSKGRKRKQAATYLCPYCGKLFRSNYSSKDHPHTHTCKRHKQKQIKNQDGYLCHICGKLCKTSRTYLRWHIQHIHEENKSSVLPKKKQKKQYYNRNNKVRCDICQKILHESSLKRHQLRHTKPHTCVICGMSFVQKQKLVTHLQNNHKVLDVL